MNSTSSDVLQTILSYFDIKEISRKCPINHLFDRVCRPESFWKRKLSKEYSIVEKEDDETWRSKAKEVYTESILFWNDVDENIHYCMWNYPGIEDLNIRYEKSIIDHAFKEKKEFFVTELMFNAFFNANYTMSSSAANDSFCKAFINLFKRIAFLSPRKKISIKWILNIVDRNEKSYPVCRIFILVDIYLKHDDIFIDDVGSIDWKRALMKHNNLLHTNA